MKFTDKLDQNRHCKAFFCSKHLLFTFNFILEYAIGKVNENSPDLNMVHKSELEKKNVSIFIEMIRDIWHISYCIGLVYIGKIYWFFALNT